MGNAPPMTSRKPTGKPQARTRRFRASNTDQPQLPNQTLDLKVPGSIPARPIIAKASQIRLAEDHGSTRVGNGLGDAFAKVDPGE